MKYLVTRQNPDGSYDEVGMNNRTIFEGKSYPQILRKISAWANGRSVRIEEYPSSILGKPSRETIISY
jgi:hypothetical protein